MTHINTAPASGQGAQKLPHLITLNQASDDSGIPERSLRREIAEGRGPTPIKIGGRIYFDLAEFADWIEGIRQSASQNKGGVANG